MNAKTEKAIRKVMELIAGDADENLRSHELSISGAVSLEATPGEGGDVEFVFSDAEGYPIAEFSLSDIIDKRYKRRKKKAASK